MRPTRKFDKATTRDNDKTIMVPHYDYNNSNSRSKKKKKKTKTLGPCRFVIIVQMIYDGGLYKFDMFKNDVCRIEFSVRTPASNRTAIITINY